MSSQSIAEAILKSIDKDDLVREVKDYALLNGRCLTFSSLFSHHLLQFFPCLLPLERHLLYLVISHHVLLLE